MKYAILLLLSVSFASCTIEEITFDPSIAPEKVQGTWVNYDIPLYQNGVLVGHQSMQIEFVTNRVVKDTITIVDYSNEVSFTIKTHLDKKGWQPGRSGTTKGLWYKTLFYATEPEGNKSIVKNLMIEIISVNSKGINVNIGYREHLNFLGIENINWVYTNVHLEKG